MKTILCLLASLFAVLFIGCKSERAASKSNTADMSMTFDGNNVDVKVN